MQLALFVAANIIFSVLSLDTHDDYLFQAVASDQPDMIELALQAGSDINAIGSGGQSPLMYAVLSGRKASVEYLLANGADTSIPEKDGFTPMHGAGFQGRWEIAQILIDHGLDPRDRHKDGYEAIHRASWGRQQEHMQTAQVLIEAGVPFDVKADDGQTPLDMANENTPVFEYLQHLQNLQHHEL